MAKFRKRPIVIDAVCFSPTNGIPEGVIQAGPNNFVVRTIEGDMKIEVGDWLITGVEGEKYPCKPSIFEATYEEVHEDKDSKFDRSSIAPKSMLNVNG